MTGIQDVISATCYLLGVEESVLGMTRFANFPKVKISTTCFR